MSVPAPPQQVDSPESRIQNMNIGEANDKMAQIKYYQKYKSYTDKLDAKPPEPIPSEKWKEMNLQPDPGGIAAVHRAKEVAEKATSLTVFHEHPVPDFDNKLANYTKELDKHIQKLNAAAPPVAASVNAAANPGISINLPAGGQQPQPAQPKPEALSMQAAVPNANPNPQPESLSIAAGPNPNPQNAANPANTGPALSVNNPGAPGTNITDAAGAKPTLTTNTAAAPGTTISDTNAQGPDRGVEAETKPKDDKPDDNRKHSIKIDPTKAEASDIIATFLALLTLALAGAAHVGVGALRVVGGAIGYGICNAVGAGDSTFANICKENGMKNGGMEILQPFREYAAMDEHRASYRLMTGQDAKDKIRAEEKAKAEGEKAKTGGPDKGEPDKISKAIDKQKDNLNEMGSDGKKVPESNKEKPKEAGNANGQFNQLQNQSNTITGAAHQAQIDAARVAAAAAAAHQSTPDDSQERDRSNSYKPK